MNLARRNWFGRYVPAPRNLSSPRSVGNAEFGLGVFVQQPGDKALELEGSRQVRTLANAARVARRTEPALRPSRRLATLLESTPTRSALVAVASFFSCN